MAVSPAMLHPIAEQLMIFIRQHKMFPDAESSAADAVLHGTDVECGNHTYKTLIEAVKDGKLTEKDIDVSLKRLFTIRFPARNV